ncbi:MAG: cardiolipin synthetase, partial [Nitrospira sp.]|nr:cardiolipin synthetase [Nitrospira sp.]
MDAPRQLYNRERDAMSGVRALADQAFSRAAGAPLIEGNTIRLLNDARENYPAWLDAISAAKRCVHFENYIIRDDEAGRMFAEALVAKAQAGVRVRVMYDWLGGRNTSRAFWNRLRASGVDVRCYNPPRWDSPLGWLSRNHRKTITVDGQVGFVTGLCVGRMWVGVPEKNIDPWRDTGVEVRGPAVADIERTFADVWAMIGEPIPERELFTRGVHEPEGETVLRVVATVPATAGMFRVDQLVAALAKHRLWLVDAYYAGTPAYVQALCAAAGDGVDVRLLVPNATDIPLLKPLSRAGYRPLLEAGMRVFEWNGTMLHAKTAVADGRWARVGSTNLNIASWFGNCEIDVVVEDEPFAHLMEQSYLKDLENATEVVLDAQRNMRAPNQPRHPHPALTSGGGSGGRAAAGALRIGNAVGAAFTNRRVLEPVEGRIMVTTGAALLTSAMLFGLFPRLLAYPLVLIFAWIAAALLYRGYRLHRKAQRERGAGR